MGVSRSIKYLVMDVDGTLTDGKIYMSADGEIMKAFNIKDGCGISNLLPIHNIEPIVITSRSSVILKNRCCEIGISEVYQNVQNKLEKLKSLCSDLSNVAYIGDDINDIPCMEAVKQGGGLIGAPNDAVDIVRDLSDFVSKYNGGDGAVRDFIEWIVK